MKKFSVEEKFILIVDDMKLNFSIVKQALEGHSSWKLHFLQDPRLVTQFLYENKVDLILLDYEMPFITGPELCQEIKSTPSIAGIPILFFTASPSHSTIEVAFNAGADDYINKPICPPELLSRIERIFYNQFLSTQVELRYQDQVSLTRTLSHDLNNYISIISGSANTLSKKLNTTDETLTKSLARISRTCERMAELVVNIRSLQALDDKKIKIQTEKTPVFDVLQGSISNYEEKLTAKNIKVHYANPIATHETQTSFVWADKTTLLNSVFGNIISNAIKFSNRGDQIDISSEIQSDKIVVEIRDHGIGMNQALLEKVFSKTEKTSRQGTDNESGTGFGMPLVKSFMEQYGGQIELRSTPQTEDLQADHGTAVKLIFKKAG